MSNNFETDISCYDNCVVCHEKMIDIKSICNKYNCSHSFHKKCIINWRGSCPLCRSIKKEVIQSHPFKGIVRNVPEQFISIYMNKWKNIECKQNNHSIFFKQPYGVIGVCETCTTIQAFNLSHPCQ
jgi:hypothetical protein